MKKLTLDEIAFVSRTLQMYPPDFPHGAMVTHPVFVMLYIKGAIGGLDLIAIDDVCHAKHGYIEEEHGSLRDFIVMKFPEIVDLIERDIHPAEADDVNV